MVFNILKRTFDERRSRLKNKSIFTEAGLQKNSEILIRVTTSYIDFNHLFTVLFFSSDQVFLKT